MIDEGHDIVVIVVCTQAELTEQRNAAEAEIDLLEKRREEAVQACMRVQSELCEAKDNKEYHQASTTHKIVVADLVWQRCCCCRLHRWYRFEVTCSKVIANIVLLVSSFTIVFKSRLTAMLSYTGHAQRDGADGGAAADARREEGPAGAEGRPRRQAAR